MPIQVTRMAEADIDGAITTIQEAFANDPYNNWVYPDRSKVQFKMPFPVGKPHNVTLTSSRFL